jgi:hypothetical protein
VIKFVGTVSQNTFFSNGLAFWDEIKAERTLNRLDPALNEMIVESIHADVMKAVAAKGRVVYDMRPDEPDELFQMIAFNVKEEAAQHFKGLSADRLKMYFDAIDDSINGARARLKR